MTAHQPANDSLVAGAPVGAPKMEWENGVFAAEIKQNLDSKMDELMSDIGELQMLEEDGTVGTILGDAQMMGNAREELEEVLERTIGTAQAALALVRSMA